MAHFAQINDQNIVINIVVVNNNVLLDDNNDELEENGINFLKSIYGTNTKWVQTSYNNSFRFRYAGRGYIYDETNDVFYLQQPFDSWILNTSNWEWEPPIDYPNGYDGTNYNWDEENQQWNLI